MAVRPVQTKCKVKEQSFVKYPFCDGCITTR